MVSGGSPSSPPLSLVKYTREQVLWQNLGLRLTDLDARPWQEVEDYWLIMSEIENARQAQSRRQARRR